MKRFAHSYSDELDRRAVQRARRRAGLVQAAPEDGSFDWGERFYIVLMVVVMCSLILGVPFALVLAGGVK